MGKALLCLLMTMLVAAEVSAAPITYLFSSGSAKITATAGGVSIVDDTIALDGLYVTFDTAIPSVIDFSFTAPQSAPISMETPYGGYDTFVVESATIDPGVGYSNFSIMSTGPNTWSFLVGPVDVAGVYSASHTSGLPLPVSNLPAPFIGASFLNGSIDTDLMTFDLLGVTLAQIDGTSFGEDDLIVKADLSWTGTVVPEPGTVVPEPGTATLLAAGLVGLGAKRRRIARRQSRG